MNTVQYIRDEDGHWFALVLDDVPESLPESGRHILEAIAFLSRTP